MTTQVLRYPYEAITDSTDYLQISISKYDPIGDKLTRTNLTNTSDTKVGGTKSKSLYTQTLNKTGGVILLPMPSNIQDGNAVSYGDSSVDAFTAIGVKTAEGMMTQNFQGNGGISKVLENISKISLQAVSDFTDSGAQTMALKALAAEAVSVFGGNITANQLLARENGQILNPNMELLFNGVTLRTFRFSFKMTPRDDKESGQIKYIIRSLKRNMAAKSGGTFLNSPNIFELRYRQGNDDHPFLHKFKPCALTDMAVNYTGENVYATYGDGTPVSMTMDLTFKELVPIYDIDYTEGGKDDGKDLDSTVGY
jgi:hypothetical protein